MIKTMYLVIVVIITLIIGLAFIPTAQQLINGARDDLNCSASLDVYDKLPCVISGFWLYSGLLLMMFMFIGIIYFKKREPDNQEYNSYSQEIY